MRMFMISLGAAAASLALAAPAAAQWAPQPHGYAYGYHSNYGQVRALQVRIQQLQRHIIQLDRRGIVRSRDAQRMYRDAQILDSRLLRVSRNGLTLREARDIELRLARIEQRVAIASRSNQRWGYRGW
ncbi:MAG TPA: hypothetical protein VNH53_07580 [Sphingomicrobium sp.]|jgi:hypothetical protein|nr:hypothetical protein [Sphingomicrobium sp.]